MTADDVLEKYLIHELKVVNKHLPIRRKYLRELLNEKYPYVECADGGIHMFRKSELNEVLNYLKEDEIDKILLPIILEVRADLRETTAVVRDEYAAMLISRILGIPHLGKELYLYPAHLAELRRKVGTLIQYVITFHNE